MDDDRAMDTELRRALTEGCALDGVELDERLAEIERLTRRALRERRDEAGTTVLTFDRAVAHQVRDLVRRERECCGHLEFAVEESDELIRVAIRSHSDRETRFDDPAASSTACGCPMCGD
jgi:hypothetical protein